MLPMLDPKKMAGTIMAGRKKPGVTVATEVEAPMSNMDPDLKTCAEDVLRAIEHKSVHDLAKALKAAFEYLESMPHEENESEEPGEI